MAKFKLTSSAHGNSLELESDNIGFDRLVLEACGGGVTATSTAKAMEKRRELLDMPVGGKLILKANRVNITFERLAE